MASASTASDLTQHTTNIATSIKLCMPAGPKQPCSAELQKISPTPTVINGGPLPSMPPAVPTISSVSLPVTPPQQDNSSQSAILDSTGHHDPIAFLAPAADEEEVPEHEPIQHIVARLKADATKYMSFASLFLLCTVEKYLTLLDRYTQNPKIKAPVKKASETVAHSVGRGKYFARKIRTLRRYIMRFKTLPPTNSGKHHAHPSLLNNECVAQAVRRYLTILANGEVMPNSYVQ